MSNFLDIFNKQYFPPEKAEDFVLRKSQLELLKRLAQGYTIKQIAERMNLKYYNVQKRTQLLYKKFKVKNRTELIQKVLNLKIISHCDLTPRFRKRFFNKPVQIPQDEPPRLRYPLSEQEITFLKFSATGATRNEIVEQMHLLNLNFANCIAGRACFNLGARNITEAVAIAYRLKLI